jgi:hypothetical protein
MKWKQEDAQDIELRLVFFNEVCEKNIPGNFK